MSNAEKFVAHMNARLVSMQYGPSLPHFLELDHIRKVFLIPGMVRQDGDKLVFISDHSFAVKRTDNYWVSTP